MDIYDLIEKQVRDDAIKKVTIGAVIRFENDYIVLRRAKTTYLEGYYEIPNGNMEFGETIDECIYRIINEKIGCQVKGVDRYLGHFDYISSDNKKTRQYNFLVQIKDFDNVKLSEKHDDYKLASIFECENILNISDETLFAIKTANTTSKFNI